MHSKRVHPGGENTPIRRGNTFLNPSHKFYASNFQIFKFSVLPFISVTRTTINCFLCVTQLGICCVYLVFVAVNLKDVVEHYHSSANIRYYLLGLLIPMILLNFLKNLKFLVPVSIAATILSATGELIEFQLFQKLIHISISFNRFVDHILFYNKRPYASKSGRANPLETVATVFRHGDRFIRRNCGCFTVTEQHENTRSFWGFEWCFDHWHDHRCRFVHIDRVLWVFDIWTRSGRIHHLESRPKFSVNTFQ